jgi:hypothetical protein
MNAGPREVFPAVGKAAGTAAIVLVPVAIVPLFLPAVNRFTRARKGVRMA